MVFMLNFTKDFTWKYVINHTAIIPIFSYCCNRFSQNGVNSPRSNTFFLTVLTSSTWASDFFFISPIIYSTRIANSLNNDSGVTFTYSGLAELFDVNQPITSLRTITGEYYTKLSSSENNASSSQSSSGYTLKEIIDSSKTALSSFNLSSGEGTLNSTSYDDMVILTGGMTHRGLDGDDLYFVSNLISENSSSSIVDTSGNNIIQIPDNTYIDSIIFSKDATRIRLEDSRTVTINGADKFIYNLGGNKGAGDPGENLSFVEFANAFGVSDVLSLSGTQDGVSDIYIV